MPSSRQARDEQRYELLGELASGGMATVYLARMRRPMGFSRLVAIKCMHPQFAKDPSFVSMFMDEARLTARLRHPNIVPTLDIVANDGHLLLVMEYVEGASLARLLRLANQAGARIPVAIACAIIHDLLLGLHEAHQAKDDDHAPLAIVHRDVSPQNVLVGLDGMSRVLDFGVAKARQNTHHSNDNEIKGKIPYMPPEQLFGEALDHKVDVYAAGVTLWEALVCERLFDGPSETVLVKKISEDPIARPSAHVAELPPEIDAIVMKALSRDPEDRFESALAMAEAIASVVALPTRTEVSAWVRQYVAPREVPSGSRLPVPAADEPVTTILAILEKASLLRPSAKRSFFSRLFPLSPTARGQRGSAPCPPAARGQRGSAPCPPAARGQRGSARWVPWWLGVGVAASAFAVAGVAIARVARSEAAASHVPAITPPTTPVAPPPAAAVVVTPSPDRPEVAPVRAKVVARALATKPVAPRSPVVAEPEARPAAAEPSRECRIPFTIDESGHKHYKVECIP